MKGLIFDMDGTLLDSMEMWDNVGIEFLEKNGIQNVPDGFSENVKAMGLMEISIYINEVFDLQKSPKDILDEIIFAANEKYLNSVPLKKGVKEFLEKNKHFKMCVATASEVNIAKAVLKRLGILDYFEFVLTCEEVGEGKTSPKIYLKSAELMGISVDETVVFEDALYAIISAKNAGFKVVAVHDTSFADKVDEIKALADYYVHDLNDIALV